MSDELSWFAPLGTEGFPANVLAGFTLGGPRGMGHNLALHVGDDAHAVVDRRRTLQARIGARAIQWLDQVHGAQVLQATAASAGGAPAADGVWTAEMGLALGVMTADCVPVLLWSADGGLVGAAHAGWRGLRNGVIEALIHAMPEAPSALAAWIGPCISQRWYEVGEDVWSQFEGPDAEGLASHASDPDKRMLDLAGLAARRLAAAGVAQVSASGLCTYDDPRFFSFRRARHEGGAETGRMACLIMRGVQGV